MSQTDFSNSAIADSAEQQSPLDSSHIDPLGLTPRLERGTGLLAKIEALIEPELEVLGFALVRLSLYGNHRPTLQIMAEPLDGSIMDVQGCSQISHAVSTLMDVEDPVSEAYHLEVSSPGLDRPLTRPRDFTLYYGYELRIELDRPIAGQRRFRGKLDGWREDAVRLICDNGTFELPYHAIVRAKLVSNDALAQAATKNKLPRLDDQHPLAALWKDKT